MLTNGSRDSLLCRIFENILSESITLANKIAIWHVPDPRQIISTQPFSYTTQTNKNETEQREYDGNESCTVQSITFGELNLEATRLAEGLAEKLIRCGAISGIQPKQDLKSATPDTIQASTVIALFMPPGIKRIVAQRVREMLNNYSSWSNFVFAAFDEEHFISSQDAPSLLDGMKIACMKLHLAYLPLDRQLSVGRIVQILDLISPAMVILTRDYHDIIFSAQNEASARFHLIAQVMNTSNLEPHSCFCFNDKLDTLKYALNRLKFSIYENLIATRLTDSGSTDNKTDKCLFENVENPVITVLFTSGSTSSDPKIVRLRNNQLLNRLNWQWESNTELDENQNWLTNRNRSASGRNEVILASTACLFVDAFTELFSALFAGNPVVVPGGPNCTSEMCVSDVRILYKLIHMFQITRLTTVPIQLRIWIYQMGLIEPKEQCKGDSLTTVVVSGDMLQPEMARQFFHLPISESKVRLLNFYGTTEMAGDVTAAIFHDEQDVIKATKRVDTRNQAESLADAAAFITVGRPIFNTAVYVVRKYEEKTCMQNDVISERTSNISNLSVIGTQLYKVDWRSLGYEICEKGCVGEVAVTGLPVNWQATDVEEKSTDSTFVSETNHISPTSNQCSIVNFPGDLGFICPDDNMLYVCGRSDEVVKINAVGFLASDVDRILLQIKENCFRNPQHVSHLEKKLINIRDSVTLPIHHPASKSIQLVCFYVASSRRPSLKGSSTTLLLSSSSNAAGADQQLLEERMDFRLPLSIIHPQSMGWNDLDPKPNELSVTIGHYLPVYIRPIFLRINHIPVMPTSGKVDKNRLRSLFNDTFVTERENHSPCKTSQLDSADELTQVICPVSSSTHTAGLLDYREQARKVLGSILGLQPTYNSEIFLPRPRDDEDFYLLGGNSLMAVLALESLRQLGFKVHLETFYLTSNIGQLLDSIEPPRDLDYNQQNPMYSEKVNGILNTVSNSGCSSMNTDTQISIHNGNENICVREWCAERPNSDPKLGPSYEDLVKLLVDAFDRKDTITRAFQLSRKDLETAATAYLKPNGVGIVLIATCRSEGDNQTLDSTNDQLVGVLLSVPSESMPNLPEAPKLTQLQKYFDFCCSDTELSKEMSSNHSTALTVIMAGVCAPSSDRLSSKCHSLRAKWNRVTLEILAQLESQLLKIAKWKNFTLVETLNTCETTKEVCADLGYQLVKSTRMQTFAAAESLDLDQTFLDHCSYYMIKRLND
ncbi:uncharacterized protein DEA37_0014165 [Paragonimus westermani]|uniref:Uncharacterized protein n=1 Tax=Paragonimus westermani TaxID=34504 RepID=A0A5J4P2N4_9TREM|nr:uncharacterized protein DEA37_0014165 [Paragonimus westermani]